MDDRCIEAWGTRYKPYEVFPDCPPRHKVTVGQAMTNLLRDELGFGGRVTSFVELPGGQFCLATETFVLACRDVMYWSGPKEAMQPLAELAQLWCEVLGHSKMITDQAWKKLTGAEDGSCSAFAAVNFMPLLIGRARVRMIALLAAGVKDAEQLKLFSELPDDDLWTILQLAVDSGRTFADVHKEFFPQLVYTESLDAE